MVPEFGCELRVGILRPWKSKQSRTVPVIIVGNLPRQLHSLESGQTGAC
jgi:hypothetical protein